MFTRDKILIIAGLQLLACSRIEYTLHNKKKSNSTPSSQDMMPSAQLYATWNSMDDYSVHLDKLKQEGPDALLKIYHEDGRHRIRLGFRRFRDAIARDATHDDSPAPWSSLQETECRTIEKTDLFDLGGYGDLRSIIDTAFLGKLNLEHAAAFNPGLPARLDEVTKLAFFEFGIKLEGDSSYLQNPDFTQMQSTVDWQVIHEQQEEASWAEADENGVRFSFKRQINANGDQIFILEALVSPRLEECTIDDRLPAMSLRYVRRASGAQHLFLKKGYRAINGTWQEVKVSRRISLLQNLAKGELFTLIETNRFDLPGESSRSFTVSLKDQQICSVIRQGDADLPRSPEPETNPPKPPMPPVPNQPSDNGMPAQDNPNQSSK